MRIYLLQRQDADFDEARGFVIAAPSVPLARTMASQQCGDEGADAWLWDASCDDIGEARPLVGPRVILRDFMGS